MAGVTVFVSTDVALQGADLVSGGQPANVKKGVELLLLNNLYTANGPSVPGRGQSDVSVLLRQGLDFLSKSPHDALGVPVGCRTPEVRKAYKKLALKYHPDKNPLTTPLFQLMSSAHDRLTDPVQRQKEERTAAAKNPKPTPKPPQQQQPSAAPPSGFSAAAGHGGAYSNGAAGSNPTHGRQTYDPKTGKWSADAEWGKYQQQQPTGPTAAEQANTKAQEAARRKQYYDEILREQFKKAESDRKAKEYAALREAQAKARAQGAAGGAAGYSSAAGATAGTSAGTAGSGANNYYNYQNPHMKYPYPGQQNTAGAAAGAGGSSSAHGATPNYYSHYTRPTPPSDPTAQGGLNGPTTGAGAGAGTSAGTAATGTGSYAGKHSNYKPIPEAAKVNPQNVPLYGKIPSSREAPPSAGAAKPDSSRRGSEAPDGYSYPGSRGSAGGTATSARTGTGTGTSAGAAAGLGSGAGIAAGSGASAAAGAGPGPSSRSSAGAGSDHGGSSSNLRGGAKPNASRVPRPYGLRCLFVGANAAELEWVTSKYHRNNLLAELSWRIKEGDMNASWRGTWESASKLISSGKCRKKNLVAGAMYEFRVRAVEELTGGLLGYRSDWSDSITVQLLPDKTTYTNGQGAPGQGQGATAASPSHRGLGAKPSGRGKDSAAFSFPDADEKQTKGAAADSSAGQQKSTHTFERFSSNPKTNEPRVNIYDTINTAEIREKIDPKAGAPSAKVSTSTAGATAADGRKSTSALPTKADAAAGTPTQKPAAAGGTTSSTSNLHKGKAHAQQGGSLSPKGAANSPLPDLQKINLDNVKRYPGGVNMLSGMGGSGRNVWGPDSITPTDSRSSTAKDSKTAKSNATAAQGKKASSQAAKKNKNANGSDDGEIEEDIQDNRSIAEEAREVDDEVNTVGVDEDSQSVQTTSAAKPAKAAGHGQGGKSSTDSKKAATASAGAGQHAKKSSKGEFADFTIEVEDGTDADDDDEDEAETEYDEDDFDVEYEELYTLVAPPSRVKAVKKSASSANLGIYSHPVRSEPVPKSAIVGYLVLGTDVVACADAGNWLKVRIHKQPTRKNSMRAPEDAVEWGWSLRADKQHEYLKPNKESLPPLHHPHFSPAPKGKGSYYAPSTPLKSSGSLGTPLGNRSMTALPKYPNSNQPTASGGASTGGSGATRQSFSERDVPVWMELFDVSGHAYYFNEATGESKWEPPEWVEERDPATGAKYYVNLSSASADPNAPLHSTWTKPAEFARLLRT